MSQTAHPVAPTTPDLLNQAAVHELVADRYGGRAIGLDILPEMLERGAMHAREASLTNVEWLRGEIENIPLPDASVDVVVSNGVVNLSPRKSRVLFEAFRVLRRGGRISVADIIVEDDLPPEVIVDPQAWAG